MLLGKKLYAKSRRVTLTSYMLLRNAVCE